ncbi:MAG: PEP-CTERM sorting domain-containing protein [Planctomycetia bacterium]|nr:PEP-CTERM sorting domain-containing protein [Planctomycetia bacterium]
MLLTITPVSPNPSQAEASFTGLGTLSDTEHFDTGAYGLSADGLMVTGFASRAPGEPVQAVRWSGADGMVGLPDLPGGSSFSSGWGLSNDGSVIVGNSDSSLGAQAFRWTHTEGIVGLGYLPGGSLNSQAFDVSADGSVVVGYSLSANSDEGEAFRWTDGDGMVGLGDLPEGGFHSVAFGVSGNGAVIVGGGRYKGHGFDARQEAFRWTVDGGMVGLGFLPAHDFSVANNVSADGAVVVGVSGQLLVQNQAFRWSMNDGMVGLNHLPTVASSTAENVSASGEVVVGSYTDEGSESRACFWFANQMFDLQSFLLDKDAANLTGWKLTSAEDVSADGRTLTGLGINPDGGYEAWLAILPPLQLPGDTNGDGEVNIEDLNNVRNNFGGSGLGDTDGEGSVTIEDLNAVRNAFGAGSATTVPEPAAGLLAGLMGLTLLTTVATLRRVLTH